MATTLTSDFSAGLQKSVVSSRETSPIRRRITPQAGHALEILGHAIEYLADEFVFSGAEVSSKNAQLEAVQLLMGLNRKVYFECPIAPTLGQRIRRALLMNTA